MKLAITCTNCNQIKLKGKIYIKSEVCSIVVYYKNINVGIFLVVKLHVLTCNRNSIGDVFREYPEFYRASGTNCV